MAWTCVCCRKENAAYRRKCSKSECRFSGGPPEAWDEKRGKDKRKDKQHASLLEEKKQERDELKIQLQNYKHLRQRPKASKALEVAKLEEGAFSRQTCDVELLELRYGTEAGSADLCHFESPGVQTVAAPLSPIQWAAGFRKCLNTETRDVFDAFCKELEQSPDSGHRRDTCHSPRACSREATGSWSFRARMDPYLAPPRQGVPQGQSSIRSYRHIRIGAQR